jgi:hypothetical protein
MCVSYTNRIVAADAQVRRFHDPVLEQCFCGGLHATLDYPDKLPEAHHTEIQLTDGPRG